MYAYIMLNSNQIFRYIFPISTPFFMELERDTFSNAPSLSLSLSLFPVRFHLCRTPHTPPARARRFLAARSRSPQLCGIGVSGFQESLFLAPAGSCCGVGVAKGTSFSISLPQSEQEGAAPRTDRGGGVTKSFAVERQEEEEEEDNGTDRAGRGAPPHTSCHISPHRHTLRSAV